MRVLIMAAIFALAGCSQSTREITPPLAAMGFTEIHSEGWAMFGCDTGGDNVYATRFTARGANGTPVKGVVCKGWFKGQTVRYQ